MRRVDDIGRADFYCSCGGTFGYTKYTLPYLRDWLVQHRLHDTSPTELEVTQDLRTFMGWTEEQVKEDVKVYIRQIEGETTNGQESKPE